MTRPDAKKEREAIRDMIHQRLKARVATESPSSDAHLDEDAICAFVEGRLEDAEASPVISHLIVCSSCRHTTAQLVRFESQFDLENDLAAAEEGPGRVRALLDRLTASLTPSIEEDAVFAYHEPTENPEAETEAVIESNPEKPVEGN